MDQKFEFFSDDYVFEDELSDSEETRELIVRLDKWLWAARFFKTRAVARAAVEKGKVFYNGERAKPSREIELGAIIYIQQGRCEKTVIVRGLSTRRRSTEDALQLFEETEESRLNREQAIIFQSHESPFQSPYQRQTQLAYPSTSSVQRTKNHELQQDTQPKERHAIRFLRRSFNRNETRPTRTTANYSKVNFEIFD